LFDETCSTVAPPELIWVLLHRPPPPMPPWLGTLVFLGEILGFAQASQQHGLAEAASCQIAWQLDEYCLTVQEKGEWVAA
jgi:hypothetical protein